MALYEFKREAPRAPLVPPVRFRWSAPAAALLVLAGAMLQILGGPFALECSLVSKAGIPSPANPKTILLCLNQTSGPCDPMDMALALRGLSMLSPAMIILPRETVQAPEQAGLLESVKTKLRELGIPLVETAKDSPLTLYRPVPLCRYLFGSDNPGSSLPKLSGSAPAGGTMRFSAAESGKEGLLPLLAHTPAGDLAGSIWWDALMSGQSPGPVWLLTDRFLVLPNHDILGITAGCTSANAGEKPGIVPIEDFLLRMEERERGGLSPRFDDLWHGAVVVVSSREDLPEVTALSSLRATYCRGSLPVTAQVLTAILLSLITAASFLTQGTVRTMLAAMVIIGVLAASSWILFQGNIPPLIPWLLAVILGVTSLVFQSRESAG